MAPARIRRWEHVDAGEVAAAQHEPQATNSIDRLFEPQSRLGENRPPLVAIDPAMHIADLRYRSRGPHYPADRIQQRPQAIIALPELGDMLLGLGGIDLVMI